MIAQARPPPRGEIIGMQNPQVRMPGAHQGEPMGAD